MPRLVRLVAVTALMLSAVTLPPATAQEAPGLDLYPNCEGFIDASCCCTANACFDVPRNEIERLTEDTYRIIRTGEVVKAKGRSPHGRVRRCTGNRDETGWHMIGHPDARTTCLYVTDTGS